MFVVAATLFASAQSHSCVENPQCFACEQTFEACVPDPVFHSDEELRFEYGDGMCSCDADTCHETESQYSFIDPVTEIPIVVFRLKCCPTPISCTTTSTTTTTTTPLLLETTPTTTPTTTGSTTDMYVGSGDAADDKVMHKAKTYHSSSSKSGACDIRPISAFLMGIVGLVGFF